MTLRFALFAACVALPGLGSAATALDLTTLPAVPRHELPQAVVQQALAGAREHPLPERFAVGVALGLPLDRGLSEPMAPDLSRWRLRLHSPGATSLSAHLTPLNLPAGAQLWIYGPSGRDSYGPFTQADVTPTGFWSPLVGGDEMVLEVRSPASAAKDLQLEVAEAFHGYRSLDKASTGTSGPGGSGACNHDAFCQQFDSGGHEVRPEIRSVAMMTFAVGSGMGECSGELVNNVKQDHARLFLTARHCGIGHGASTVDSVNFYFNYQNTTCDQAQPAGTGTPAPQSSADFVTGGVELLADDIQADFALLRINNPVPSTVYFAGWDATGQNPTSSGAAIHHPNEDDKKISLYDSIAPSPVDIGTGCTIDAWQVHWASGTTEPGSSGGGLWHGSTEHYLIGVLSGGYAACVAGTDPNTGAALGPNQPDYFARLDRAWVANSGPKGQLKYWLDPTGNCIARIPGIDASTPGSTITAGSSIPTRCDGVASVCKTGAAAGGSAGTLALGMLGGVLLRRRRRPGA